MTRQEKAGSEPRISRSAGNHLTTRPTRKSKGWGRGERRETDRQTDRQTDRHLEREREREGGGETETEKHREVTV